MRTLIVILLGSWSSVAVAQEVHVDARRGTLDANFNKMNVATDTPNTKEAPKPPMPQTIVPSTQSQVREGTTQTTEQVATHTAPEKLVDQAAPPISTQVDHMASPPVEHALPAESAPFRSLKMRLPEVPSNNDSDDDDDEDDAIDDCE